MNRWKGTQSIVMQKKTIEKQQEEARALIAYLEDNLDLVKKLELQERSVKNKIADNLKISESYQLINSIIREDKWLSICVK